MKRIFLSLPMHGKSDEEILNTIEFMKKRVRAYYNGEEIVFVDNFIITTDEAFECASCKHSRLAFLSKALTKLANCDVIAILSNEDVDQGKHPGVLVESMCAKYYGIDIYYIYPNE